jgi:hypothetical protein
MAADELTTEVCGLIDCVYGLINLFMHYVVKHSPRVPLNLNLFMDLREFMLAILAYLEDLIIGYLHLTKLNVLQYLHITGDHDLCRRGIDTEEKVS